MSEYLNYVLPGRDQLKMFLLGLQLLVDFNDKFGEKLAKTHFAVIEFCSEDCDFCRTFDAVFDKVVAHFDDSDVVTGTFSCRTDPHLCKRYGVKEHPWVAIFKDQEPFYWYYGPRHQNVLIDWIERWTSE